MAVALPQVTLSGKVNARRHGLRLEEAPSEIPTYNPFGRPGGGAPKVNQEGKVEPVIKRDRELHLQDKKKMEVEIAMVRRTVNGEGVGA